MISLWEAGFDYLQTVLYASFDWSLHLRFPKALTQRPFLLLAPNVNYIGGGGVS